MTSAYIAVRNGNLGDVTAEREVTVRTLGESPESSRIVIAQLLEQSALQVCRAYGIGCEITLDPRQAPSGSSKDADA